MDKKKEQQVLLQKYLQGKASPSELKQVEAWYASFEKSEHGHDDRTKKRIGQELHDRVYGHIDAVQPSSGQSGRIRLFRIAASILMPVLLGTGAWWFFVRQSSENQDTTWVSVTTAIAQRKKIQLPDSSEIWLNASSRLLYPKTFSGKERLVRLEEGEAFFEVMPNKQRLFKVVAPNRVNIQVLGTSFTISAYPQSENIQIAVSTGKVAVDKDENELGSLMPGERIKINRQTFVVTKDRNEDANAWTRNELIFNNQTLQEVADILERTYGIHIHIKKEQNKYLKCRGVFRMEEKPEQILNVLCALHGIDFRSEGKDMMID